MDIEFNNASKVDMKEAVMIEPTETESKQTLDGFCDIMLELAELAEREPEVFAALPKTAPVSRPDETRAARKLDIVAGMAD